MFDSSIAALLCAQLLAIVAFGSMSDQESYNNFSAFEFLVASGVLTFVWLLFLLTAYLYDWHAQYSVLNFAVRMRSHR